MPSTIKHPPRKHGNAEKNRPGRTKGRNVPLSRSPPPPSSCHNRRVVKEEFHVQKNNSFFLDERRCRRCRSGPGPTFTSHQQRIGFQGQKLVRRFRYCLYEARTTGELFTGKRGVQ